jgi:hypothetical protein
VCVCVNAYFIIVLNLQGRWEGSFVFAFSRKEAQTVNQNLTFLVLLLAISFGFRESYHQEIKNKNTGRYIAPHEAYLY